jgi:intracellular septation protein A
MLRRGAEAKFRNFEGIQYGRRYNNAAGAGKMNTEILDPNDRTWTIAVANAATTSKTATIFGANYDLTDTNLDGNITITVSESTHLQVKTELLSQPVRILGMKMTVSSSATQFSNVLSIYDQKSTGALEKRLFQPLNYRSAQNYLTTQIDVPSFELLLSASTYIQFTVNGSETVTFTFTIVEKTLVYNTLRNSSVVAVSNQPAPTGLPQIDMPRGV